VCLLVFIQPTAVVVVVEPGAIAAGAIADDAGGYPNTAVPITLTVAVTIITVAVTARPLCGRSGGNHIRRSNRALAP
jgi:hypothetical protein